MAKTSNRARRALTLVEILLSLAMLSLFLLIGYEMLHMANKTFQQVVGNEDATMQLKRAVRMLQRDIVTTNINDTPAMQATVANVPASLPAGAPDGSALCMLSGATNGTGDMVLKGDGEPLWQRNILYYVVVPQGDPCGGGADAQGFDDRCPHKLLIRKIIDVPPTTTTAGPDETTVASAMGIGVFLTRPAGRVDITNMSGEANVRQVELVARGLVSMQIKLPPPYPGANSSLPNEVEITLTAFNEPRTSKLAIGTVALTGKPGFLVNKFSLFPRNNR